MKICYSVKQLGKKHPIIKQEYLEIESLEIPTTLRLLLKAIVKQQVQAYNDRKESPKILNVLNTGQLKAASQEGKITFGDSENTTLAIENTATETALQAFEDGLFAIFLGEEQIESLEEVLTFDETTIFSFIRLTFLAGSIW